MGRLRIVCCAYRSWALQIVGHISQSHDVFLITEPDDIIEKIRNFTPDLVFLLGWSWIVPKGVYAEFPTICLHPSPLPKYRGGSPLQHQIINGEKESAVTFFKVDDTLDGGDIVAQKIFSLEGTLKSIFDRITSIGIELADEILANYPDLSGVPQLEEGTVYKRRTPEESEIKDFSKPAEEMYNFIRALDDPYPNAFIVCGDGKKLYFKEVAC